MPGYTKNARNCASLKALKRLVPLSHSKRQSASHPHLRRPSTRLALHVGPQPSRHVGPSPTLIRGPLAPWVGRGDDSGLDVVFTVFFWETGQRISLYGTGIAYERGKRGNRLQRGGFALYEANRLPQEPACFGAGNRVRAGSAPARDHRGDTRVLHRLRWPEGRLDVKRSNRSPWGVRIFCHRSRHLPRDMRPARQKTSRDA